MSEVLGALSHALDITEGQPDGHAIRTCLIGMRIGEALGLDDDTRSALFYALLLKDAGCSSNSARTAQLFGASDFAVKRTWKLVDWSRAQDAARHTFDNVLPGRSRLRRALRTLSFARLGPVGTELVRTRCERGAEIARMVSMPDATSAAIRALDEHWDGGGKPDGLAGDAIPLLGRILCLAQAADIFASEYDAAAALRIVRARSGTWFDPSLVTVFSATCASDAFWRSLRAPDTRERLSAMEPPDRTILADDDDLDRVANAFARIIDAKSPYTFRHSEGVAQAAAALALALGMPPDEVRTLRRAALLHDIGKLGVSNTILDKPGRLDDAEMRQIRLHPEYTEQILGRAACFQDITLVAASHHERLDGAGYHRGVQAGTLPLAARILAVADVYDALSADRPYRAALPYEEVARIIQKGAGTALCERCVTALPAVAEAAPSKDS